MPRPAAVVLTLSLILGQAAALMAQGSPAGSADAGWARLRAIKPGSLVRVTPRQAPPVTGAHLSADEASLIVLTLTDPDLPADASRTLRELATQHPEYFDGARKGATYEVGNLRLSASGLFVANRKIAELPDLVATLARSEVAEVSLRERGRGFWGHLGPLGGYFLGAMSAGTAAAAACGCDGGFLPGGAAGGLAGGFYGLHAARRQSERVIYRAAAQAGPVDSFQALPQAIGVGQEVKVRDDAGRSIRGRVTSLTDSELVVTPRRRRFSLIPNSRRPQPQAFTSANVQRVVSIDSGWNGAVLGAAAAIAAEAVSIHAECSPACNDNFGRPGRWVLYSVMFVPIGLGVGGGIDSLVNRTVFERPDRTARVTLVPAVGPARIGVMARVDLAR